MIDWFPLWLSLRVAAVATFFVLTIGNLRCLSPFP